MKKWIMKTIVAVAVLFAAALIPRAGQAVSFPSFPQNVILLSWDGFDRSVLLELLAARKLPNLEALIAEGSLQNIEVAGHVTVTKPGHAEMLTGLDIDVTGVVSNSLYRPIPEGDTIFERLQRHFGGKEKIRTVMVSSKISHVGGRSAEEVRRASEKVKKGQRRSFVPRGADDSLSTKTEGEPFYLTRKHLDVFDPAQRDAAETGPLSLKFLNECKVPRFFAFLHFSDPDHNGHRYGIDSSEYRRAAEDCDHWLGEIVRWLKKESLYDQTLIYAMTDHGFDPHGRNHLNAPDCWLATNDKGVIRGGIIADVPATILERFGVDLNALDPELIGLPLTRPAPADRPIKARPNPAPALEKEFDRLDLNHDGKLSRKEFSSFPAAASRPRIFTRIDGNGDGYVTLDEFKMFFPARRKK